MADYKVSRFQSPPGCSINFLCAAAVCSSTHWFQPRGDRIENYVEESNIAFMNEYRFYPYRQYLHGIELNTANEPDEDIQINLRKVRLPKNKPHLMIGHRAFMKTEYPWHFMYVRDKEEHDRRIELANLKRMWCTDKWIYLPPFWQQKYADCADSFLDDVLNDDFDALIDFFKITEIIKFKDYWRLYEQRNQQIFERYGLID